MQFEANKVPSWNHPWCGRRLSGPPGRIASFHPRRANRRGGAPPCRCRFICTPRWP